MKTYCAQTFTPLLYACMSIHALHMYAHIHNLLCTILTTASCCAVSRMWGYGDTTNYVQHQIFKEQTHHNSYAVCTLPNLFTVNLFQQQRHMK